MTTDKSGEPLNDFLRNTEILLKIFLEQKDKIKPTSEFIECLRRLIESTDILQGRTEKVLQVLTSLQGHPELSIDESHDRNLDRRLAHLKKDVDLASEELQKGLEGEREDSQPSQSKNFKMDSKKRRKMFKSVGSDEKWIPM